MTTTHSNERVFVLCALIVEEKDPGKFLLLVRELDDAFETMGVKFERATSTTPASRTATSRRKLNKGIVSQICCTICDKPLALDAPNVSVDENGDAVHTDCYVERLLAARNDPPPPHHAE
jgi:hypothetical protein